MSWSDVIRIADVPADGLARAFAPNDEARAAMADLLELDGLPELTAQVSALPWFDGVEVTGAWRARVAQTCGVTLEPLESTLAGEFRVRIVPSGSDLAPTPESLAEMDPEAEDPPEISEDGTVDLAALVYEHLAIEIDPFPRKPGAEFAAPAPSEELSPFAVLRNLKLDEG